jgi:SAM-dependent methyltransferase
MQQAIMRDFERGFLSHALSQQVAHCDAYELAPLLLELFRDHQPVLEAGCGSGRWCGWLARYGIRADGVDWSHELCARAQRELPQCRFVPCDMAQTPFPDGAYGGLMALGSVEHSPQGPLPALREFARVLRPGGVAVVTVPYGGPLRRAVRRLTRPALRAKGHPWLRRLLGKRPLGGASWAAAARGTTAAWMPRFVLGERGWYFYEYEFHARQMRRFLTGAGFSVRREFVAFADQGVLHTFGRVAGRWNPARSAVDLTPLGRLLRRALPVSVCGHMLCYVVHKPGGPLA